MTNFGGDFLLRVALGDIPNHSIVPKFGYNDAVPSSAWESVWALSTGVAFPTAATTVRIKAGGNALDTAAGAGAREVYVQGLDSNGDLAEEAIATAGASASSATSTSFWRVFRGWVSACGTYGANQAADITIENSAGTQDLLQLPVGFGQSQHAAYAVPDGFEAFIINIHLAVNSTKAADFRLRWRENLTDTSAPVSAVRTRRFWTGINTPLELDFSRSPIGPFPGLSDIWVEARGNGGTAEVSADYQLLVRPEAA